MVSFRMPGRKALLLTGATLLVAYFSASAALVNVLHARLPSAALAIDSNDPVALVRDAQIQLATGEGLEGGPPQIFDIARRSVLELPINAPALRLYGLVSSANSDLTGVRDQMALSDRMSRRDSASQLWLIEDAVARNDVAGALRHYDVALRINEPTRALLYPVLTDALEEPVILRRFLPYMVEQPPWLVSFLRHAVSNTRDPRVIVDLARMAGGFPKDTAYASLDTELLRHLVIENYYEAAIDHFRRIDGADPALLTSLQKTDASTAEAFKPISWEPYSIDGISPILVGSETGGIEIESDIESGYVGPVARKLLALPTGRYSIRAQMRGEGFGQSDSVTWSLTCGEAATLLDQTVEIDEEFAISGGFTVPSGCPAQMLTISARTGFNTGGVTLVLARAELTRDSGSQAGAGPTN